MDPTVPKATVDEYNCFYEKGHDGLFAKDQNSHVEDVMYGHQIEV